MGAIVFGIAGGLALVLSPLAARAGRALGVVDRPSAEPGLKIHGRPVPVLGGAAVVAAAAGGMLAAGGVGGSLAGAREAAGGLEPAVVAALLAALAVGQADDLRPLPPWVRVAGLLAAGGLLAAEGVRLEPLGPFAAWVVPLLALACANGVNLLDGQDGLAASTAGAAALGLAAVGAASAVRAASGGGPAAGGTAGSLGLALGGALLGFLAWNRPPARIFLGNGGAYAAGVGLAAVAAEAVRGWPALLAAGIALGIPAFELALTVVRRVGAGAPLARGDRAHSYDLLAERLGSRGRATLAFALAGLALAGLAPAVAAAPLGWGLAAAAVPAAGAAAFGAWALRAAREVAWTSS